MGTKTSQPNHQISHGILWDQQSRQRREFPEPDVILEKGTNNKSNQDNIFPCFSQFKYDIHSFIPYQIAIDYCHDIRSMSMVIINNHIIGASVDYPVPMPQYFTRPNLRITIWRIPLYQIKKLPKNIQTDKNEQDIQIPITVKPYDVIKIFRANGLCLDLTDTYPLYVAYGNNENQCCVEKIDFHTKQLAPDKDKIIKIGEANNTTPFAITNVCFYKNNSNQQMIAYSMNIEENNKIFLYDFMNNKLLQQIEIPNSFMYIQNLMVYKNTLIGAGNNIIITTNIDKIDVDILKANKIEFFSIERDNNPNNYFIHDRINATKLSPNSKYIAVGNDRGEYGIFKRNKLNIFDLVSRGKRRTNVLNPRISHLGWLNNEYVVIGYGHRASLALDLLHIIDCSDNVEYINAISMFIRSDNDNMTTFDNQISYMILDFVGLFVEVNDFQNKFSDGTGDIGTKALTTYSYGQHQNGIFIAGSYLNPCVLFVPIYNE